MRAITGLGQVILRSGVLSASTRTELENTLAASGLHGANGLAAYIGGKLLLMCGLPVVTWLSLHNAVLPSTLTALAPAVAGVVGLMAPDWILGRRRRSYLAKLDAGLPDALDMMVICAQAGLALGPAIVRVARPSLRPPIGRWRRRLAQTAKRARR